MKTFNIVYVFTIMLLAHTNTYAQTFFETAEGEGVVAIRDKTLSQIKINTSSTAITYGYFYVSKHARGDKRGLLINAEAKVKPNDNGFATLVKSGKLQPGMGLTASAGYRFSNLLWEWNVLDIYVKPEWAFAEYSVYDTNRKISGQEALYKANKNSFKLSAVVNAGTSIGKNMNLFLGLQYSIDATNNISDLDDVTIQNTTQYPGSPTRLVFSDVKNAKMGVLENLTKRPFSADLVFDPGLKAGSSGTTIKLGVFTYYRSDGSEKKYRNGVGICLLSKQNPSKVFASLGFEFPTYGKDVKEEDRKKDNGVAFASIGLTIE